MPPNKRCAVYTRKSSEEGLEQEFNSLHAQREACEAYIKSQRHEGWTLVPDPYDDGGVSGGTLERPALQRLLSEIRAGRVDIIVVYKVDRLTRALSDFARMVEIFDEHEVSFVSVTQQFNTTCSMGRLTLNVLLSFAQFEREVTGERIRDKFAASRKKGMWMGGHPPLGYDLKDRKLVVNAAEAERVRLIFELFVGLEDVREVKAELDRRKIVSKRRVSESGREYGGNAFSRGAIYKILNNRIYLGEVVHKENTYPGEHDAIIGQALWHKVQALLDRNRLNRRRQVKAKDPSLLAGLIFDEGGSPFTPSHAVKDNRRYRYYIAQKASGGVLRLPALETEKIVISLLLELLGELSKGRRMFGAESATADVANELRERARELAKKWSSLEAKEARGVMLNIVNRITLSSDNIELTLDTIGLTEELIGRIKTAELDFGEGDQIKSAMPYRFEQRYNQKQIITTRDQCPGQDPALIRALGRAWGWRRRIERDGLTIKEIAKVQNITPRYVWRLLQIAWLAPDLLELILDGRQPRGLTLESFRLDQMNAWHSQWAVHGTGLIQSWSIEGTRHAGS